MPRVLFESQRAAAGDIRAEERRAPILYLRLDPDARNIYRSEVFPGVWLKADAFVAANLAEVLSVLKGGLDSVEHQEFVRRLASTSQTT